MSNVSDNLIHERDLFPFLRQIILAKTEKVSQTTSRSGERLNPCQSDLSAGSPESKQDALMCHKCMDKPIRIDESTKEPSWYDPRLVTPWLKDIPVTPVVTDQRRILRVMPRDANRLSEIRPWGIVIPHDLYIEAGDKRRVRVVAKARNTLKSCVSYMTRNVHRYV